MATNDCLLLFQKLSIRYHQKCQTSEEIFGNGQLHKNYIPHKTEILVPITKLTKKINHGFGGRNSKKSLRTLR